MPCGSGSADQKSVTTTAEGHDDYPPLPPPSSSIFPSPTARSKRKSGMSRPSAPRPIQMPGSPMASTIPHNLLPSAPASPPTPAPSPTPTQRAPDWSTAEEHEESSVKHVRALFADMSGAEKQRLLAELLNLCDSQQLGFVQDFVSPRLKKDPFRCLPDELCLRVRTDEMSRSPDEWELGRMTNLPCCLDPHLHRRPHDSCAFFTSFPTLAGAC